MKNLINFKKNFKKTKIKIKKMRKIVYYSNKIN